MGIAYEVVAITGKYTNAKGEEKNRYLKCGVIIETKSGLMLKMEAYPIGGDGSFFLNTPKPKDEQPSQQSQQSNKTGGNFDDIGDDIPF